MCGLKRSRRCNFAQRSLCIIICCENNIPISKVPSLVKFSQFLSKDSKALSGLKLDRSSANYKLNEGLAQCNHESLVNKLKSKQFFLKFG